DVYKRQKQKGSRGIRRGQWYRLVFQFPIRQGLDPIIDPKEIIVRSKRDPRIAPACAVTGFNVCLDRLRNVKC
ncbi:hypothetical protein DZ695_28950, partial [Klebsiella pneumoniae]